jgi:PAS domain S-box-containing protein
LIKVRTFFKPRDIGLALLVAVLYFAGAKLGLSLAFINASVSPVWPPTGIAIALVLWFGYRALPGVLVGALVANYTLTDVSLLTALGIAAGNGLEAFTAVYLLRRFVRLRNPFNRAIDVLRFAVFAAIISTAIAATIGNLTLCLAGKEAWASVGRLWFTWWLGDGVGALVITPLLLSWFERPGRRWRGLQLVEACLLLLLLLLLSGTIYTNVVVQANNLRLWGHISIPLLLWAAFRFGPRGVSTAMAALSAVAIWGTIHGTGPFGGLPRNEGLLYLQAYVADFTITMLALAAIVNERRQAQRNLSGGLAVTRILAESPAIIDALPRIIQRVCSTFDWKLGAMWTLDTAANRLHCLKVWPAQGSQSQFEKICYELQLEKGVGLPGRVWQTMKPAWIPDVTRDRNFPRAPLAAAERFHAAFGFPIVSGEKFLGVMEFFSEEIRELDDSMLSSFGGIGSQIGQFIERKEAEEAMELASLLPEENPYPVCRLREGRLLSYVNPAGAEMLSDWNLGLGDEVPAEISQVARAALADGNKRDLELSVGDEIYMVDFAPVPDANYVNLYFSDITERKQAEIATKRLAAIVESSDDAIIGKDLDGIITTWNSGAERLYGYTAGEAIGKSVTVLIPPERPDEEPEILARLRRGETIDHYETVRITKDGRRLDVSLTVSPIIDAGGKVVGASKIARDVTQKRRAEREREELLLREHAARSEAEAANRIKDEFLATLSHELRTPLTAMLGWLSMLRGGRLDGETSKHALETVERNARAQAQLIEDLVDVSRIAGGKLKLDIQPVDLSSLIAAASDIVRPAANARGVNVEILIDPAVGPVAGDAARLQQIIWNLLSNAVKFTPRDGSVYVSLRRSDSFAELEVRDTGIGIDPDFLPWVFERFRQAESSVTRSHRGLGLGLAIVRHLTELHGGTVMAHSGGEGQGATFTIRVPVAEAKALRPAAPATDNTEENSQMLSGFRVLLVEDEPDARELLSLTLKVSGAQVEAVDSARAALSNLQTFKPDVLLSDIGLPVESGYDLIRQVRSLPTDLSKIPAVALTAFATEKDRQRALNAGFQIHLSKPVEPQALIEVIEQLLNGKRDRKGEHAP